MNISIAFFGILGSVGLYLAVRGTIRQMLAFLLFTTPFVQSIELPFVGERFAVFEVIFVLLAMKYIIYVYKRDAKLQLPIHVFPLVLLIVAGIASLWNSYSLTSSSLMLFILIYYVGCLIVCYQIIDTVENFVWYINMYLAGAAVVLLVSIIGMVAILMEIPSSFVFEPSNRLIATFRRPNQLPAYLHTIVPLLALHPARSRSRRHFFMFVGATLLSFLAVIASGSDGSLVILIVQVMMVLAYELISRDITFRTELWASVCGGIGLLIATPLIMGVQMPSAVTSSFDLFTRQDYSLQALSGPRYLQFVYGVPRALELHPIVGVGIGASARFMSVEVGGGGSIHNTFLAILATTGIVGGVFFLAFHILLGRTVLRTFAILPDGELRRLAAGVYISLAGLLAYGTVHFGFRQRHLWLIFIFVLSLGKIAPKLDKST
ncbi:O-antigen ligase family protein [Natronosalvus caseinilyticus]|uniref:O-antigen ligase family protein n=1 Tax=Natronosalvus caseinilyticus TaxID=2953747 RepID=UPI0028B23A73|nr:O-antigen ligase family protein [Natronosalvus caseinilyticus]